MLHFILFTETSGREFKQYTDNYIHYFEQGSNTGMQLELLQKFVFIPLDIFKQTYQNRGIQSELDAWLVFLSTDEPETIIRLITEYPAFKPLYEDIYRLCLNVERVMEMFSKELAILDKNTVIYMIDEMQRELDEAKRLLQEKDKILQEKESALHEKENALHEKENALHEKDIEIQMLKARNSN